MPQCLGGFRDSWAGNSFFPMVSLRVKTGISEREIVQLLKYSYTDKEVLRFTSDLKRFAGRKAFDEWFSQGRIVYTLVDRKNNLLGIAWFGEKTLPEEKFSEPIDTENYGITFAIRIYEEARGKSLAKKFMTEAFLRFFETENYRKIKKNGIWLQTSIDNIPALKTYLGFGFRQVSPPDKNNKIIMVYPLVSS